MKYQIYTILSMGTCLAYSRCPSHYVQACQHSDATPRNNRHVLCRSCSAGLILRKKSSWGLRQDLLYSLDYKVASSFDVYLHQTVVIKASGARDSPEKDQDKGLRPEQGEVRQNGGGWREDRTGWVTLHPQAR